MVTADSCAIGNGFRVQENDESIGRCRDVDHPKSVFAAVAGEDGATVTFDMDFVFG